MKIVISKVFFAGDVGYSEWASWSYCSKSCGGGEQISRRECMIPNGGCSGKPFQVKDCNTTPCPGMKITLNF